MDLQTMENVFETVITVTTCSVICFLGVTLLYFMIKDEIFHKR